MTEREGFWGGVVFFNLNTHAQKEGEKNHLGQWWRGGGGGTCSSQAQGGREGATHVLRRGGGDRRDTGRQRKQRAEKCGFYLTAFVILPRHAKEIFACVRERKRERERETINRRWGAIVGHREKGERGEGQEGRVNTRKHFSVRITDQRCVLVFFSHNTQIVPC